MPAYLVTEKLEVALARHPSGSQIVPDHEHRHGYGHRNNDGPDYPRLPKHHVVAFCADCSKPSDSNTLASRFEETGLSFGMRQR